MSFGKYPPVGPGERRPDEQAKMTAEACDIAVSEMTGIPVDQMCGWILVSVDHTEPGQHRSLVMQGCGGYVDDEWAALWLERAAADIRESL